MSDDAHAADNDAGAMITHLAHEQARQNHDAIEQACEAALQGGECGVRVTHNSNGTVTAEVHPDVPYGTIHEYPYPRLGFNGAGPHEHETIEGES